MRAILGLVLILATASCRESSTPVSTQIEAGTTVANDVCSLIEGIDDSGVIRNICATVEEIAQIVQFILTLRAEAGVTAKVECTTLPHSTLCATSVERAKGVLYITQVRARRFTR